MMRAIIFYTITSLISGLLILIGCNSPPEAERINIVQALSSQEDLQCYESADKPVQIKFPKDSGPHETFRTEWWYYTGNLKTVDERHFGYQLTFFRQATSCEPIVFDSASTKHSKWRTNQIYFAHFALTDTQGNKFYSDMRMNRNSLGISGAQNHPFAVWIDDWQAREEEEKIHLSARTEGISITLYLGHQKPIILQGKDGLSRKGRQKFNASYYYSNPRLNTSGNISIGNNKYFVTGHTWFDHEWSTSALDRDVAGWDWFSVHLDDGRDLMVCQIRDNDGRPNGFGFGSISFPDGRYEILKEENFAIKVKSYWKSPETSREYPGAWHISIPGLDLELSVKPVIPDQEHVHLFPYWEGAARFIGKNAEGYGYVELTGY